MSKFKQRIYSADDVRAFLEQCESNERKVVESLLGTAAVKTFYTFPPRGDYKVKMLLSIILGSGMGYDPVNLQLTLAVYLIKVGLRMNDTPRHRIDEVAENFVRGMDLPPPFKLQVKQALFDKGAVAANGISMLR